MEYLLFHFVDVRIEFLVEIVVDTVLQNDGELVEEQYSIERCECVMRDKVDGQGK